MPPELAAAAIEFDAWSQSQLLREQSESTPSEPLYHYTGEAGMRGILESRDLWCMSHLHMNDPTEFEFSLKIARRVIQEVGQNDDFFVHHFCGCLDDLLDNNSLAGTFGFYLFSLSRHRDDEGQWRDYGRDGQGFALGFAPKLFEPREQLKERANENVFIGRVVYGEEQTAARHRLVIEKAAEITSRVAWANESALRAVRPVPYLRSVALEVIASQLVWNCVTAKDVSSAREREVRYILMATHGTWAEHAKYLDRGGARVPYIETPVPLREAGNLSEILVGPTAPEGSEALVREVLIGLGYDATIPIIRSSVSYRSGGGG
jgi:Protein of unknown function (DUF2971)